MRGIQPLHWFIKRTPEKKTPVFGSNQPTRHSHVFIHAYLWLQGMLTRGNKIKMEQAGAEEPARWGDRGEGEERWPTKNVHRFGHNAWNAAGTLPSENNEKGRCI